MYLYCGIKDGGCVRLFINLDGAKGDEQILKNLLII